MAVQRRLTYTEYAALPDTGRRFELIEGELFEVTGPSGRHQRVVIRLAARLLAHVEAHDLGEILTAPLDVILDEANVVQPDILFIPRARIHTLTDRGVEGVPPELVVEVLSPSTSSHDQGRKRGLYQRFRVPHLWLVEPEGQRLEELVLEEGRYRRRQLAEGEDRFAPALFPGLAIPLAEIWPPR